MNVISAVFHPLMMTGYMSALLAIFMPEAYIPFPEQAVWQLVLSFFILTALFPALFVFGLWMFTPLVTDLELTDRKERLVPFVVLILFYSLAAYVLVIELELGPIIRVLLFSAIVMIAIMLVINTRFKISIHCSAAWALAGYALGLSVNYSLINILPMVFGTIVIGGLIGTSRLYLGCHKPTEVWLGTIFGLVYSFLVVLILL